MNSEVGTIFLNIFKSVVGNFLSEPDLLLFLVVVFIALPLAGYLFQWYRYEHSGLKEIDGMTGTEFELYLVHLFEKLGYKVQHIGKLGDYGGDLIIEKDGVKTLVQAKRQRSKVKENAVQQAIAAKEYYHCDQAMVVTNNFYWKHAWRLGKETGTTLWTRKELQQAIATANQEQSE